MLISTYAHAARLFERCTELRKNGDIFVKNVLRVGGDKHTLKSRCPNTQYIHSGCIYTVQITPN